MRLLFFSTVYPSDRAPTRGIYNHSLVEALALDHDVRVVAPIPWTLARRPRGETTMSRPGPAIETLRPVFLYPPGLLRTLHGRFLWLSARTSVRRLLRRFRPEAVISYWTHPDGDAAVRAAAEAGAPVALIVGGSDVLLLPRDERRRRAVIGVLQAVDAVLAVGTDLRQRLVELGISETKVHLFRRGVSDRFRPGDRAAARKALGLPAERKTLVWVGNMVPVKAVGVLLDAAEALIREDGLDLQVCLVGDGPLRARLETRVAGTQLEGRVRFGGTVGHECLPDWYQAADLTVLPSLSEGTPNVLLESMACGTPFVASRVGGVPALSRTPEQELVPPGDPTALRGQLRRQLEKPMRVVASDGAPFRWRDSAAFLAGVVRGVATLSVRPGKRRPP